MAHEYSDCAVSSSSLSNWTVIMTVNYSVQYVGPTYYGLAGYNGTNPYLYRDRRLRYLPRAASISRMELVRSGREKCLSAKYTVKS